MTEQERCPECHKPKAESLDGFFAGTHCALIQEACRQECRDRELAAARAVVEAAEELRGWQTTAPPRVADALNAALAEYRKAVGR